MATPNPASKAEERRRLREALADEMGLQENLLRTVEKQTQEYENSVKVLKNISLQKQIITETQKALYEQTKNIDMFENNIQKRNQRIIDDKIKLNILEQKAVNISARAIAAVKTQSDVNNLLALQNMWKRYTLWQQGSIKLQLDEIRLIKKVGDIQKLSLTQMYNQNTASRQKTKNLIIQAGILDYTKKIQRDITESAKEEAALKEAQKNESKLTIENWIDQIGFISNMRDKLDGVVHVVRAMGYSGNGITKMMSGPWLIASASLLYILKQIWGIFQELDKSAFEARKEMGMMRDIHQDLRNQAEGLYKDYLHLGVTTEQVYKTQKAIANELGSTHSATKGIVTQVSIMSSQLGIAEETSVQFLKTMGQMGNTTAEVQTNMLGFAGALSNAAGVPFPQIMNDVAKASETTRTMLSKTPMDMIKAAVEARRLGTTLDKMTSSSRKLLNFSESIADEMEASVMLGRPINLQLARQLAYSGKIEESNKNILGIAKNIKFEQLDPLTMESFAKATGKSVDELKSMLQADREQLDIRRKATLLASQGDLSLQRQLDTVNELKKANEAAAKAAGEDYNFKLKQTANQERMTSISNSWKKVMLELGHAFLPLIDGTLKVVAGLIPLSGYLVKIVGVISGLGSLSIMFLRLGGSITSTTGIVAKFFKTISTGLGFITAPFQIVKTLFLSVGDSILSLGTKFTWVGKLFSGLSFVGKFAKAIPVLGEVIMAVEFVYSLVKRLFAIDWKNLSVGEAILAGIRAVGGAIYDATIKSFVDAYYWIKESLGFGGNSPSKLGLSIVNGISSIGSMLFDSIVAPFKHAWDWISNLFSSKKIQPSLEKPIVDSKIATTAIPVDKQIASTNDNTVKSYRELNSDTTTGNNVVESKSTSTTPSNTTMQALLEEIKGLRSDLTAGKIAVNLDGQLISTNMNRGIKFRGQYGAIV